MVRKRTRQFFAAGTRTPASVVQAHVAGVRAVVETAVAEAGTSVGEARWVVPPFVGLNAFEHGYERPLGLDRERTLLGLGLRLGARRLARILPPDGTHVSIAASRSKSPPDGGTDRAPIGSRRAGHGGTRTGAHPGRRH